MRGPQCIVCDRGNCTLVEAPESAFDGWCEFCVMEFRNTMQLVNCARGECGTPFACRRERQCVQLKAAVTIVNGSK